MQQFIKSTTNSIELLLKGSMNFTETLKSLLSKPNAKNGSESGLGAIIQYRLTFCYSVTKFY